MKRFTGKAALVTGAASGIGRATALRLASEGALVFATDIDDAALAETVAAIASSGGEAAAQRLDVADPVACRDVVAAAVARFGRLDVLCNVAGILQWNHVTDVSEADWNRIVAINLSSVFFLSQAAIPHLLATQGVIVNMASAAAVRGQAYTSPYCATKAAVVALTKAMAVEYAKRGLRVVAVAPGGVKTPLTAKVTFPADFDMALLQKMMPLTELAEADEIAGAVAYLASSEARYVNGALLNIDGAQTAG